ncbi:Uu.00g141400.m01.CDS01 [Anthostomella pinea]|uniref:Uu.00g141400.m01.CDS01 n=1 Tax=Anthostomella pinea TaxID=933095 RepID=A0AAI8VQX7_9PEZI|nr:Uu.00g141400.m01.CDS01 [Anthostomella pinea]
MLDLTCLWALAALFVCLEASPTPNSHDNTSQAIAKRDACNGLGSSYEIGKTYSAADCPTLQDFLPDGVCDYTKQAAKDTQCSFFCQVSTTFEYMTEQPIPNTYCRGPNTCTIAHDRALTSGFNDAGRYPDAWMYAFAHGISGGYRVEFDVTAGPGKFDIAEGECGYFTYVGVMKTTWYGSAHSVTEATRQDTNTGVWCTTPQKTTGDVCVRDIWTGPDATAAPIGQTIFVRTSCDSRQPTPDRQDPIYASHAAFPLPFSQLDGILQDWVHTMGGRGLKDSAIGAWGKDLKNHLQSKCGDIANWKFDYVRDPDWDWKASGTALVGEKSCVGQAFEDLGGNKGDCTGSD